MRTTGLWFPVPPTADEGCPRFAGNGWAPTDLVAAKARAPTRVENHGVQAVESGVHVSTTSAFVIELPEGSLAIHDLSLGSPPPDAPVVLAVHGITANGLSWRRAPTRSGTGTARAP